MNVIFTCGGTAGHINPAIAVANILKERHPDASILFIGAKGHMEEKLVPQAGYKLVTLPGSGLVRGKSLKAISKNVKVVGDLFGAIKQCKKIIRDFKADVIVGTGGYASFPALYAGSSLKIPTCVHESNALPGLTTKMVAKKASAVMVSFPESAKYYPDPAKVQVVGMPVRKEFMLTGRAEARKQLGLTDEPLVVSAFGSLGARAMNFAVADMLKIEQENGFPFRHIHATGSYGWEWMPEHIRSLGVDVDACESIDLREYIYDMPTLMAAADVIIGRAGASTCNEIGVSGTPAVLIPSPNVTDNHQEKNARVLEQHGGAVVLLEGEQMGQRLYDTVSSLLADPNRRSEMSRALRELVVMDSAEQICGIIEGLVKA